MEKFYVVTNEDYLKELHRDEKKKKAEENLSKIFSIA